MWWTTWRASSLEPCLGQHGAPLPEHLLEHLLVAVPLSEKCLRRVRVHADKLAAAAAAALAVAALAVAVAVAAVAAVAVADIAVVTVVHVVGSGVPMGVRAAAPTAAVVLPRRIVLLLLLLLIWCWFTMLLPLRPRPQPRHMFRRPVFLHGRPDVRGEAHAAQAEVRAQLAAEEAAEAAHGAGAAAQGLGAGGAVDAAVRPTHRRSGPRTRASSGRVRPCMAREVEAASV